MRVACLLLAAYAAVSPAANANPVTLRGSGSNSPTFCPLIAPILPSECEPNNDCSSMKCTLNWDNEFVFDVMIKIDPCSRAASISVELDLDAPVSDKWSHSWALDEAVKLPVPSAAVDILSFEVGLFAEGELAANAKEIRMTLALDLCASIFSYERCGQDLTYYVPSMQAYVPFVIFNHTFSIGSLCEGGLRGAGNASATIATQIVRAASQQSECCGASCSNHAECASGMFCCPNHHECMDRTTGGTVGPACDSCRTGALLSVAHQPVRLVSSNGAGCCGARCTATSQCAHGMFCCPNHNECMDSSTGGTVGPACDSCQGV